MILAEGLDAAFDQVTLQAAPPSDKLYANPIFGIQVTGVSEEAGATGGWKIIIENNNNKDKIRIDKIMMIE